MTMHGLPPSIIVTPNARVPDIYGWVKTVTPSLKRIRTTFSEPKDATYGRGYVYSL